jgi:hypothetical protein
MEEVMNPSSTLPLKYNLSFTLIDETVEMMQIAMSLHLLAKNVKLHEKKCGKVPASHICLRHETQYDEMTGKMLANKIKQTCTTILTSNRLMATTYWIIGMLVNFEALKSVVSIIMQTQHQIQRY